MFTVPLKTHTVYVDMLEIQRVASHAPCGGAILLPTLYVRFRIPRVAQTFK